MMHELLAKKRRHLALLLTRLIIGGIFITTGWMKVSDIATTIGFFDKLGIPAFFAYVVGYFELIGGILLVLGLYTCLAAGVLAVIMIFAIWFSRSMGFQGIGLPLATLAALLSLFGVCGGKYSMKCACGGSSCGCGDSCDCSDSSACDSAPAGK